MLHVAEKPSIAAAIAGALANKGKGLGTRGERGMSPVHEFQSVPFAPQVRTTRCAALTA